MQRLSYHPVIFYVAGASCWRWCYADDVLFGATISGRNIPIDGIEETLGLFINTLPLRLRDDGATLLRTWHNTKH